MKTSRSRRRPREPWPTTAEPEDACPRSRVVSRPAQTHACAIDCEIVPLPEDSPVRSTGATHMIRAINWNDPPGTIRECGECGARWIAVKHPRVTAGTQQIGVYWERVRAKRRRWWR